MGNTANNNPQAFKLIIHNQKELGVNWHNELWGFLIENVMAEFKVDVQDANKLVIDACSSNLVTREILNQIKFNLDKY